MAYGRKVQLRHIFSNKCLSLNSSKIGSEHGSVEINLSSVHKASWCKFMPSQRIRHVGESISYQDSFFIENDQEPFYLHINEMVCKSAEQVLEISGSHLASRF